MLDAAAESPRKFLGPTRSSLILLVTILVGSMIASLATPGCREKREQTPRIQIGQHAWFVDVAADQNSRYKGLSGRKFLSEDVGMLFVYPEEKTLSFCMRNCDIPLDIAFLDANRRIVDIQTMQVEPDRAGRVVYESAKPSLYALEVRAGILAQKGVKVGQQVKFLGDITPATKAEPGP